ncbi:MAG: hypothetical protein MHPSP_000199 [Paramarteilia canceri]
MDTENKNKKLYLIINFENNMVARRNPKIFITGLESKKVEIICKKLAEEFKIEFIDFSDYNFDDHQENRAKLDEGDAISFSKFQPEIMKRIDMKIQSDHGFIICNFLLIKEALVRTNFDVFIEIKV